MSIEFIISEREYSAISQELKRLKDQRKDINLKLTNNAEFINTFATISDYTEWRKQAEQTLQENKERTEYLKELAHVYLGTARAYNKETGVYDRRKERDYAIASSDGIVRILAAARRVIEELSDQNDNNWRDGDKTVCGDLRLLERRICGDKELAGWLSPSEAKDLRDRWFSNIEDIKSDHRKEVIRLERAIAESQMEIKRLIEAKGRAAQVLDRLYNERYEEIDGFRKARGVTHRIHLTAEDCKTIEDAIRG
jgi:hypothetical protein